ncbi:8380_t:CDS:2 [Funneliformis mosseae]|uniref:8380_t:CDS:1 n=1 Tax=Funneliformis mosseae TaxID=27381 RepID=A0A9N8YXZ9_FUNMO|nr:8380_t:CDS:2 [Funneliformis mosseae]
MADFPTFAYHVKPLFDEFIKNVTNFNELDSAYKTKGLVWSVKELYLYSDPLVSAIALCLAFAFWTWVLSIITRNFSQVDRLWSILPVFFTWHFILHGYLNARGIILGSLTTIWGARLTYNYARKGGYKWESEDYRWAYLKQHIHWSIFEITNIIFTSLFQCFLLLAMTLPSYVVWYNASTSPLNLWDLFASIMFVGFLTGELIADDQQWKFQSEKRKLIANANKNLLKETTIFEGDYSLGFLIHGLFRYSRHPNYFCEMGVWWSYYLFSVAAVPSSSKLQWILNWTIVGTLSLTILFQITTHLTEIITKNKYPMYESYRKNTSRLIPWFPGKDITKKNK